MLECVELPLGREQSLMSWGYKSSRAPRTLLGNMLAQQAFFLNLCIRNRRQHEYARASQ